MKKIVLKLNILLLLLLLPLFVISQNQQRPKTGLVLSGGGAKGIAHLGILHALDSLNIRPDYITGTSMGSIMGALYAIGYSADEIDSIIRAADWDYILSDDIPLSDIETIQKNSYKKSLIHFNFSGNLVPKLPSGIVYGQHISEYFSKLTWRVAGINDFNDFEIPYKCVSADLLSGKAWVFDHGDLAIAMRSSMSIPTVFSPMKIDTMLLVDGGVVRNFPVTDVQKMGADIVIGSYTGFEQNVTFEDMRSLTNVLVRSSTFSGILDIQRQKDMCDIYIKYDLHGLGAKDFKKDDKIIAYGKESMDNSEALKKLVTLSKELKKYPPQPKRKIIPEIDTILISGIKTNGLTMVSDKYILSKSGLEIGKKVSKDDLTVILNNMMGTLLFDKITYSIEKDSTSNNNNSSYILNFDIVEKTRGRMGISINHDNFFGSGVNLDFIVRNIFISGSITQMKLNISKNPIAHLNYNIFLGNKKRFQFSENIKYEVLNMNSFFDFGEGIGELNIGSQLSTNSEFSTDIAYNFNTNNQLGVKYAYQISTLKYIEGASAATGFDGGLEQGSIVGAYFNHNNYNKQFFPTKGSDFHMRVKYGLPYKRTIHNIDENLRRTNDSISNMSDFAQAEITYRHLIKIGNLISLQPALAIGIATNQASMINQYALGGYSRQKRINNINMIGSKPFSIFADGYIMANLDLQIKLIDKLYLTLLTNGTAYIYEEKINNDYIDKEILSGGMSIGYDSPLGPLDAGFSFSEKNYYWHINFGFPF